ncbi:hypothetical protein IEO21_04099 [Rhodonia placenta]|uniref:Histone H1 n=1 Tax=Rhodonia placenta TaxID=104341 RepID=A0A8H7P4G9_9APHY|nr:hypothetical protein IEO21_04099 [Postia placenta]
MQGLLPPPAPAQAVAATDELLKGLKRNYLSLLPQVQIIEICLAFESHVPLHVRNTIWPADLEAAILALRQGTPTPAGQADSTTASQPSHPPPPAFSAADVPSQHAHPPAYHAHEHSRPPMASLMDDSVNSAEKQGTQDPSPPVDPAAHSLAPPGVSQPLAPYPYAPYGYTPQNQPAQPAYPHAPYYPPHPHLPPLPHAYPPPYPYPGYPPHPHASVYSPRGSSAAPMPGPSAPSPGPPPPPPANDDLPSYEEMIVEALLEMGDPEGAAPKDLFAWMASRYPLQTNFRPSASQALQKAFKRGRLEKRAGGRYRLNAAWEGGATSKRTTRRPQTLAQTAYAMHHPPPPPSSPFTNAPLTHHHPPYPHANGAHAAGAYPGYSYGYPPTGYPGYPGYPTYPPPSDTSLAQGKDGSASQALATTSSAPGSSNAHASSSAAKDGASVGDTSAWEAAQHILEAINFSSFGLTSSNGQDAQPAAQPSSAGGAAHPPPVVASAGIDLSTGAGTGASGSDGHASEVRAVLTDEERAALQAHLALLAAQLAEIADAESDEEHEEEEEEEEEELTVEAGEEEEEAAADVAEAVQLGESALPPASDKGEGAVRNVSQVMPATPASAQVLAPTGADIGTGLIAGVGAGVSMQEEEESDEDEDEDMEMVEVPTYSGEGIRA